MNPGDAHTPAASRASKAARLLPDVDPQRCTGCHQCTPRCPFEAITMRPRL